jgi:hypothetical protein
MDGSMTTVPVGIVMNVCQSEMKECVWRPPLDDVLARHDTISNAYRLLQRLAEAASQRYYEQHVE